LKHESLTRLRSYASKLASAFAAELTNEWSRRRSVETRMSCRCWHLATKIEEQTYARTDRRSKRRCSRDK